MGTITRTGTVGSLLVITGPPGAGKSTVARAVVDTLEPSALIEGDAFFDFLARGYVEPWKPEARAQNTAVTEAAGAATRPFVSAGFATVFEGVVGPWLLPTFAAATGLDDFDYAILLPSVDTCLQRVATRSGHDFADEGATRKIHDEFARATVDPRHVVSLDQVDLATTVQSLGDARRAGTLRLDAKP